MEHGPGAKREKIEVSVEILAAPRQTSPVPSMGTKHAPPRRSSPPKSRAASTTQRAASSAEAAEIDVDVVDFADAGARSSRIAPAVSTVEWNCSMTVRFITHCLLFSVLEIGQALGLKKVSPQAVV